MTLKSNFIFNTKPKTSTTQICDLEKEKVHFPSDDADFSATQVLLNSNRYIFLADPIGELARYFQVSKDQFIQAIQVEEIGGDYIALLNGAQL
jgi:hypothetical protein